MSLTPIGSHKVASGMLQRYSHTSKTLNSETTFSIFLPPRASEATRLPVLYWLSGLTCTDENFTQKAGAFHAATELGIAIVCCDTSPRGEDVADEDAYDFGKGAGFYVNATQAPYNHHYHMYDYVTRELPEIIEANFPVSDKKSICGHSMGGHGALVIGLREKGQYAAISAFAPIVNPVDCAWGEKAFSNYLGDDKNTWQAYDACHLLSQYEGALPDILIDQGTEDTFLHDQLKTPQLSAQLPVDQSNVQIRYQLGYDHSYFFIQTFIAEHLAFHARALGLIDYPFEL
ncbi:S-formylglutathione hydrolase YeiG [BD1-7 clade bacterium]|uniref:S-formylglutathione hydrolase n=1 Tax=BD1-7 clade bacterium TaxID=2029982 RepID=A0A5S9MTY3_9GAMM|nr:S-formylglutathione hydrolase YeiG [BD1-7 clade bacterium]